jgi:hypothetical protein
MPHIGFVGSILEPPENWISDTENIILKFAAGKKTIAKDRIFADPELAGAGTDPTGQIYGCNEVHLDNKGTV